MTREPSGNEHQADVLRRHREAKGLTQYRLAKQAGIHASTIHKIECASRGMGASTIHKLGTVLGAAFTREALASV